MARSFGAVFCLLMLVSCDRPPSHDQDRKASNQPAPIRSFIAFSQKSSDQLKNYQVRLKTSLGNITLGFLPDVAPEHVRNFLRLCQMGFYDHTAWHRVVRNFVIQGGDMGSRNPPLQMGEASGIRRLQPEFSKLKHVEGIVSMARGEALDSAETFVLHLPGPPAGPRQQVHDFREGSFRHGCGRQDFQRALGGKQTEGTRGVDWNGNL